jgi:hypothetical protein
VESSSLILLGNRCGCDPPGFVVAGTPPGSTVSVPDVVVIDQSHGRVGHTAGIYPQVLATKGLAAVEIGGCKPIGGTHASSQAFNSAPLVIGDSVEHGVHHTLEKPAGGIKTPDAGRKASETDPGSHCPAASDTPGD